MKPAINDIPGIGPAAVATLAEHRIKSLTSLARASVEKVSAIPGFSEARATKVIAAAAELLAAPEITQTTKGKDKKDKKDKKDNKSKGKGKEKGKGKSKDKKDKKGKGKGKGKGKKKSKK